MASSIFNLCNGNNPYLYDYAGADQYRVSLSGIQQQAQNYALEQQRLMRIQSQIIRWPSVENLRWAEKDLYPSPALMAPPTKYSVQEELQKETDTWLKNALI